MAGVGLAIGPAAGARLAVGSVARAGLVVRLVAKSATKLAPIWHRIGGWTGNRTDNRAGTNLAAELAIGSMAELVVG